MYLDAWLPKNYTLPLGKIILKIHDSGEAWQIYEVNGGKALIVKTDLYQKWLLDDLIPEGAFSDFSFGEEELFSFFTGKALRLEKVSNCKSPNSKSEALGFADSLKSTRALVDEISFQDALYIEKLSRILPSYLATAHQGDDVVLGTWLTGGVQISVHSYARLSKLTSWLDESSLQEVIEKAGIELSSAEVSQNSSIPNSPFVLPGREDLESFINEHVIDIVRHEERYKKLGIDFPSAIVLHGPPGCGKTFAVERLIEYLGWPSFHINSSSVASPYIHETSRMVATTFEKAIHNSPSVLVIDEMEAFLTNRQANNAGLHHIEEVSEFLRCIPEASKNRVLVIAMTNHISMIDPAILRRGRFDHVIEISMPSLSDIESLLSKLISELPHDNFDLSEFAKALKDRPLSDISFVVKEAARNTAKSARTKISEEDLTQALKRCLEHATDSSKRVGFV